MFIIDFIDSLIKLFNKMGEFLEAAIQVGFFSSLNVTSEKQVLILFYVSSATGFSKIAPSALLLLTDNIVSGNLFKEVTSAFSISVFAIFLDLYPWTAIFIFKIVNIF